jgi:phosphohistidine phosphatase
MSQHIWDAGCHFDNVFCSPAVRAESTIELINTHLSDIEIKWETTDELYTFESKSLFDWCKSLDDSLSEIAIVGHNPALTDFCHSLSGEILQTIPTCGYTQLISRAINSWSELSDVTFKIERILWPKALTL